ncbi:helix-turn-helix transcriptional regulator [Zhongshania sp.]|jgi:transcriptional regulator with XRE-family HTH domain|uniref:helix-turn-helix domain-containing protein n=1 Tax=Zhongshania sp. TaxID=1971902 RepID=UPI002A7F7105|nr:helix-turn-helix transcriptional regulator [Zhongshania sp.]
MTDPRLKLFGERVRQLRKQRGLSQEDFASLSGIDRSYMGNIERGEQNVTILKIFLLADTLQIRVEELFDNLELYTINVNQPL